MNNTKTNINCNELLCTMIANSSIKMNTHSVAAYEKLVQHLKHNNVEFHTYQLKQQITYRIVIKNLQPTIPTTFIM